MVPMETSNLYLFDETPVCIETETAPLRMYNPTTTLNREQEKEPYKNPNLPLAAIISGAVALVTIALLVWCAGTFIGTDPSSHGTVRTAKAGEERTTMRKLAPRRTTPSWKSGRLLFRCYRQ